MYRLKRNSLYRLLNRRYGFRVAALLFVLIIVVGLWADIPQPIVGAFQSVVSKTPEFISILFRANPYLFVAMIFVAYFAVIVGLSWYETRQPKGIEIVINPQDVDEWRGLKVINNMGCYLQTCYLLCSWLRLNADIRNKAEIEEKELRWSEGNTRTTIDNGLNDSSWFLINDVTNKVGYLRTASKDYRLAYGVYEMKIKFSGIDPDGVTVGKTGWLRFELNQRGVELFGVAS